MINDFRGKYRFLSNFHLAPVEWDGVVYSSTEHAYQAAKTVNFEERKAFLGMTCAQAKKHGRKIVLRSDWEQIKEAVMRSLVRQKFYRHSELRVQLLATGDEQLIEGNWWHDNVWGSCTCEKCGDRGQNLLGKILMQVRDDLKSGIPPA